MLRRRSSRIPLVIRLMYGAKNILKTRRIRAQIMYRTDEDTVSESKYGNDDSACDNEGYSKSDDGWKKISGDMLLGMVVSAKSVGVIYSFARKNAVFMRLVAFSKRLNLLDIVGS